MRVDLNEKEYESLRLKTTENLKDMAIQIKDMKEMIDLLEDFQRAIVFYNQDIRNAIDVVKMEQS